jgi:hypothetical protein
MIAVRLAEWFGLGAPVSAVHPGAAAPWRRVGVDAMVDQDGPLAMCEPLRTGYLARARGRGRARCSARRDSITYLPGRPSIHVPCRAAAVRRGLPPVDSL